MTFLIQSVGKYFNILVIAQQLHYYYHCHLDNFINYEVHVYGDRKRGVTPPNANRRLRIFSVFSFKFNVICLLYSSVSL